ncbi:MAG: FesM [Anaerolineaceae bacterium]|nr:FesM [Anaerolineaceae bacterium]
MTAKLQQREMELYRPNTAIDLLQIPGLGRLLRWSWGRLVLQIPLFIAAVFLIIDGLTGPQVAPRNLATVAPWVHYRGLVVIALLLVGNLFCMGCPFHIPRTLAKRLSLRGRRFPKILRNKWIAIGSLFLLFFLYESLNLWASPSLTAWVIVAYFVASFAMEAVFTESAFCKYVCPLGTFNFVYSTASPTQIATKRADVCANCQGKECINGSWASQPIIRTDEIPITNETGDIETQARQVDNGPLGVLGCGTQLFAPQIKSNLDCVFCLDCVRACPHENIGLMVRTPGRELMQVDAWPKKWDISFLVIILAFMGVVNAFGMVPPVYELQNALMRNFNLTEMLTLLLIFLVGGILLPISLTLAVACLTQALTQTVKKYPLRHTVAAFAPSFVPIGFGIWFAHYGFHFLIAPLSIIPVIQEFVGQTAEWARFSVSADSGLIGLIQVVVLVGGFLWSMLIAQRTALRLYRRRGVQGLLPWALLLFLLMLTALNIFSLPMEMRGSVLLS